MKFVYKASTLEGAEEIKTLFEDSGIPASISNKGFAQLNLFFIPHTLAVFIYDSSQYQDAIALLNNKNHIVSKPIDIVAFYDTMNSQESQASAHKVMNDFIFGMVVFGLLCGLLIYALS